MEETWVPSYLHLVQCADFRSYNEAKLNKINSEFMKDHQKLKNIVSYPTYYFGTFIGMIRSKKWEEAEENRKGAQDECETIRNLLMKHGLQSEWPQKQSLTVPKNGKTPSKSNVQESEIGGFKNKPKTSVKTVSGKQDVEKKKMQHQNVKKNKPPRQDKTGGDLVQNTTVISNQSKQFQRKNQEQKQDKVKKKISQPNKVILKENSVPGNINQVSSSTGNANKPSPEPLRLKEDVAYSLLPNNHEKCLMNAEKLATGGCSNENILDAKETKGMTMKTNMSGKSQMVPESASNVHRTTNTKSVHTSNTLQENMKGHMPVISMDKGSMDTKYSAAYVSADIIRRSEEAHLLLVQGNPNIVDLSDSNRPTKLAERYSELYSNEYTDAFEELEMKQMNERDIIQILLKILMNAYIYCQRKRLEESTRIQNEAQRDFMQQGYGAETAESLWKAQVATRLKQSGPSLTRDIYQNFIGVELPKSLPPSLLPMGKKLSDFASSSVEIVWLMCIQDPPICMKWIDNPNTEKEFDTSLFRFYRKSGNFVDYCVWPVLFLYDGGPILLKGIAQGK